MRAARLATLGALGLVVSGCFRQIVQTGQTPGPTAVEQPWTHAFLWGLMAPAPIDVTRPCGNGIATVETQMSVQNALAFVFTLGIYSPRYVKVTCATGSALRPESKRYSSETSIRSTS